MVSGNDTGTFCVKRFQPKTVAVNDIYQSASEIQTLVTNNKDKPMVEVALGRSNFVIRKQTIVGSHSDIEVPYDVTITNDVSVSTTPFISLEPINRLRMPEDPRCHEEYCIPLPCTFLDMNYAGEPLFKASSELATVKLNRDNPIFATEKTCVELEHNETVEPRVCLHFAEMFLNGRLNGPAPRLVASKTCVDAGYFPITDENECKLFADMLIEADYGFPNQAALDPTVATIGGSPQGCYVSKDEKHMFIGDANQGGLCSEEQKVHVQNNERGSQYRLIALLRACKQRRPRSGVQPIVRRKFWPEVYL